MPGTAQYITLDSCVNSYLSESEQGDYKYVKMWDIAVRGMDDMGLDFFYRIQSEKIPINSNFTAYLPSRCMQWSKIGVLNQKGEVIPLMYNDKLTFYAELSPEREQKVTDNTLVNYYQNNSFMFFNYWNGDSFFNLFGVPSGGPFVGDYKVDNQAGIIILNEHFYYNYLIVEYTSIPDPSVTYRIPIQFREAMISFLRWMDIVSMPSSTHVNNNMIMMRSKKYYNDRRLAWSKYEPFEFEDAYEWNLRNQRFTVKV
jgi:hypothetical protein